MVVCSAGYGAVYDPVARSITVIAGVITTEDSTKPKYVAPKFSPSGRENRHHESVHHENRCPRKLRRGPRRFYFNADRSGEGDSNDGYLTNNLRVMGAIPLRFRHPTSSSDRRHVGSQSIGLPCKKCGSTVGIRDRVRSRPSGSATINAAVVPARRDDAIR
jgi:hypothetical protein